MNGKMKRLLAAALTVIMALSLVVPALAAVPVMAEGEAVAEVAPADDCCHDEAHSHGSAVERPAVAEDEEEPGTLAASSAEVLNFTALGTITGTDFFTVSGNNQGSPGSVSVTVNGAPLTLTVAMKFESSAGTVTFNASAAGTLTMIVASKGAAVAGKKVKVDGANVVVGSDGYTATTELAAGSHTIEKGDSIDLYYVSFGTSCAHTNVVDVPAQAPTCGVAGHTAGTKCNDCQTILSGCEEILPTGEHTWVNGTDTATCDAAGTRTDTCSVCSLTRTVTTSATGQHTYPNGATSGICTVCGWDSAQQTYHKHNYVEDVSKRVAATCTATGTAYYTCSSCGATRTETLAKISHTWAGDECSVCHTAKPSSSFNKQKGDQETAYIEWPIGQVGYYKVYVGQVSGGSVSSWTELDDELIRQYPGYMRADALGLAAGTYRMKVVADGDEATAMITGDLEVTAQDRSGFAFESGKAPGVYNMDGTLKAGTNVVYITQETASTVTLGVDVNGKGTKTTVTGLPGILLAYKKGKDTTPLCIRIVGTVAHDYSSAKTSLKGAYDGVTISGVDQTGASVDMNHADLKGDLTIKDFAAPVTVEGVGNDAVLMGIGIRAKNVSYVEVRNLGSIMCNSGENDCIGFQPSCDHIWVHNNDLFYGSAGGDSDQVKGDGSLDTKGVTYATLSYNHFWDCGKANLCGLDDDLDYLTYHHNWYDHSDSRHPRIRYSKHTYIYNNYYDGNAKYGVGATTGSCSFVDSNYFRGCKYPMLISMQGTDEAGGGTFSSEAGGMIKAYGNYITEAKAFVDQTGSATDFDAYVVNNRTDTVPASYTTKKGGFSYNNFDTQGSLYVDAAYPVQTAAAARDTVIEWAGRVEGGDFQYSFSASADSSYDIDETLKAQLESYTTSLVKVGGAVDSEVQPSEHVHVYGAWEITTYADCATGRAQVETRYCVNGTCPDNASETRTTPASHSPDETGVCTVCGAKVSSGGSSGGGTSGGGTVTGTTRTLKATDFADGTDKTSISDTIASKYENYFSLYGDATKVLRRASSTTEPVIDFIDIPLGAGAGVQFTTSGAAQVTVWCSSTSKTDKSSTMELVKVSGTTVTPVASTAGATSTTVTKNVSNATAVSFTLDAGGTYAVLATSTSANNVRLTELSVTEAASSGEGGGTTECAHSASTWQVDTPATCGASGTKKRVCSFCGEVLETDIVEATGNHTWGADVIHENGTITHTCAVCSSTEDAGIAPTLESGDGTILPYTVENGAVTLYNTIPTGDLVLASYWQGTTFLGARVVSAKNVATVPITGWDTIKLFWLDSGVRPLCQMVSAQ